MTHEEEKSDPAMVAEKSANKPVGSKPVAAERMEPRAGAKRNACVQSTVRTQGRDAVSLAQARIREAVERNPKEKLTTLLHHINLDTLREAFFRLKKNAAVGVDAVTWRDYARDLDRNLTDLAARVHSGAYRALPSRRVFIPKADGKLRPLGIAAIEDKIVQMALVAILTPIYEAEFLGLSYGFRPGRGQHDALDALTVGIKTRNINWVLDADISRFFDTISHDWLVKFIERRIGDRRVVRLIQKWLKVGVLDGGLRVESEEGTPQGAVISPLLANIYLHYVYDLWAHRWRQRHAAGDVIFVRYADDTVVGFENRSDADRFLADLRQRLAAFANRERALCLLCGSNKYSGAHRAPISRGRSLAAIAPAAQPERRRYVGTDHKDRQRVSSKPSYPSPVAKCALRRQTPKVGAACGKAACVDLCGGRSAMTVPTAIAGGGPIEPESLDVMHECPQRRGQVGATANLDSPCARRPAWTMGGGNGLSC